MRRGPFSAALVGIVLAAGGCAGSFRAEREFSLSAAWEDYDGLIVRTRNGRIDLEPHDRPDVAVSGTLRARGATQSQAQEHLDALQVVVERDEEDPRRLRIELRYPEELRRHSVGADLVVRVPRPCAAQLDSSNGSLRVCRMSGRVRAVTSNGEVSAADIAGEVELLSSNGSILAERIDGPLTAETSNGAVTARRVGGDCTLTTSNGRIEAVDVRGSLRASSSNGGVAIDAQPPPGAGLMLRTSNGDIRATLPAGFGATLELRAPDGRIRADFAGASVRSLAQSRSLLEAEMNGGGGRISATTSNGSIELRCR